MPQNKEINIVTNAGPLFSLKYRRLLAADIYQVLVSFKAI